MAGRRAAVAMSDAEVAAYLDAARTVVAATNGHDGFPHLMPLWFVVRDGRLWGWTYAKSQKARNMARDPRVTLQVEDGVAYGELRGVMLRCEVRVHADPEVVEAVGLALAARYGDGGDTPEARTAVRAQVPKRVGLEFVETGRRVSWDHRKLAGVH